MKQEKQVIKAEDTVYDVIKRHPELKEVLIRISPRFKRLQNPVIFKTVARITTLAQASHVGNVYLKELLYQLNEAIGMEDAYFQAEKGKVAQLRQDFLRSQSREDDVEPEWIQKVPHTEFMDLRDLTEDPFQPVNERTEELLPGSRLTLIQSFAPAPLMNYLRSQNIETYVQKQEDNVYYIHLYRPEGE